MVVLIVYALFAVDVRQLAFPVDAYVFFFEKNRSLNI
jgi:hypothetical protein